MESSVGPTIRPRVIVVGAGFSGLAAIRWLRRLPVEVVLIDRQPYQTFSPLLHQVAVVELCPEQVVSSLPQVTCRWSNVRFYQAEIQQIDRARKRVQMHQMWLGYDFLVVATGSRPRLHAVPGAAKYSLRLKTMADAVRLRSHLFTRRDQSYTWLIVGGGATGVELAAALAQTRAVMDSSIRVILLHGQDRLVPFLSDRGSRYTQRRLMRLGVEVRLNMRVRRVTETAVLLQNGQTISTDTVIWTAGVEGQNVSPLDHNQRNQVRVHSSLVTVDDPAIFAIGDVAATGQPLLAPVAIAAARQAVKNIQRQLRGRRLQPFRYRHWLSMIILDRYAGVVQLGPVTVTGIVAWGFWLAAHWWVLPSWRQRWQVGQRWWCNNIKATPFLSKLYERKQSVSKQLGDYHEDSSTECRSRRSSIGF